MRSRIVITPEHFDTAKTQPRFIGFLRHAGLRVGDVTTTYEYMIWANRICDGYQRTHNEWRGAKLGYAPLTEKQHEEIDARCVELTEGEEIKWAQ